MGIPIGAGIDINAPFGADHKMIAGAANSPYATKDAIPSYWRYDGMPVWAKESGVWKLYNLSADLVTWVAMGAEVTQEEFDAHVNAANPHGTDSGDIMTEDNPAVTVQQALVAIRALIALAASGQSLANHIAEVNPHNTTAGDINTTTPGKDVQDFINEIAAKATIAALDAHIALKNPHGATASDINATGGTIQAILTSLAAGIAAIDTLSELTAGAASIVANDFNMIKALYYTAAPAVSQVSSIDFANKNIARLTVTGNLTISQLLNGKATGDYWIILKFTANAVVTITASNGRTGIRPIQGYNGSTIILNGLYYDNAFHFTQSKIFDLTCAYYFGVSPDKTIDQTEILLGTSGTSGAPDEITCNYNMTENGYPWFAAPATIPYTKVAEVFGGDMAISSRFTVSTVVVNSVSYTAYMHNYITKLDVLTFKF